MPLCHFYGRPGTICRRGNKCKFIHQDTKPTQVQVNHNKDVHIVVQDPLAADLGRLNDELKDFDAAHALEIEFLKTEMSSLMAKHDDLQSKLRAIERKRDVVTVSIQTTENNMRERQMKKREEDANNLFMQQVKDGTVERIKILDYVATQAKAKCELDIRKLNWNCWTISIQRVHEFIKDAKLVESLETRHKKSGEHTAYAITEMVVHGRSYFLLMTSYCPSRGESPDDITNNSFNGPYETMSGKQYTIARDVGQKIRDAQIFLSMDAVVAAMEPLCVKELTGVLDKYKSAAVATEPVEKMDEKNANDADKSLDADCDWNTCYYCNAELSQKELDQDLCSAGLASLCKGTGHSARLCKTCFDVRYNDLAERDMLWFK